MKKQNTWTAAFLLLLFLPFFSFAQGPISGEPKNGPEQSFSLAIYDIPAAQTNPAWTIPAQTVSPASAPSTSPAPEKFTFKSLTGDFLKDAGEIWSYPLHIRTRDILPIAGLAVLTGILINNDEAIHRTFLDYRMGHKWVKAVSPAITQMGSYGAWATAGVFLCVGLISKDSKTIETGVLTSSAMLQSAVLVTFLKGLFGRQRPSWANGVDKWSGPVGFSEWFKTGIYGKYDSFPGGHSITAFSLATVVAMQYQESVWVPILAYSTATGVALSRMTEGKHWLSDCLVGSVLGFVIGRMVVINHRRRYHILPAAGVVHGSLSFAVTLTSR
jgi:membrane-associated phospholipid phosphatase